MIEINFVSAIAAYLAVSLVVVFILWLFYNVSNKSIFDKTESLQRCPYCAAIFLRLSNEHILCCPRCKSYITAEPTQSETNA